MSHPKNTLLSNQSDQELISLIRKNGVNDMPTCISAFKILKERNYDQLKFEEEKDEILDLLDEEIFTFTKIEKEHIKNTKDMKSSIYYALGITIISAMIYIQNQKGLAIDKQPPLFLYFAISVVFIGFFVYKLMGFRKSEETLNQLDLEKKNLLISQLENLEKI